MSILRLIGRYLVVGALAVTAAPAVAQVDGGAGTARPLSEASVAVPEYIIGPEDTIDIEVVGQPDKARLKVYTDGTVQMNLLGRIAAAGVTPKVLASQIAAKLKSGGFYANPVVNVEVVGYESRYVTVLGAVTTPGLVPVNRVYHLSEILARVGGVRENAADYLLVRPENGPERRYPISKLATGDAKDDPVVAAGDKIFCPQAEVFYIAGQVKSPGSYPLKPPMSVAQAIAKGGGLTDLGSSGRVKVSRGGKTMKMTPEDLVEAGDVVTVPERLF
jgi:polysaccharide export outer membrane protein